MNKQCVNGSGSQGPRFRSLFLGVSVLVASPGSAWAQVAATISGRVEDASGGAVPGVTVTVRNLETGATRVGTTDEVGNFRALSLPVGRQEVKAEKTGFKAAIRTGITLAVGQAVVVNLKLEIGELSQEVTISAEVPLVNVTPSPVSGLVGERQVKDLPLNGRSFDNLITLNAGAINYSSMKTSSQTSTSNGSSFSVAGRRPMENLFLLNGIEYT
ncbi:MAG: carboxypeptidase regulatory-like domain-containing protein, partial [Acidobacteria bacterium]|nr:carboxypeptidase regulatory-like domain-containing protein [Acidobacteriota bacterium]